MPISADELRALPAAEKLRLVEMLWDDLGSSTCAIPLPAWLEEEASRRRTEMLGNPQLGLSHEDVWRRIEQRHG